MVGIIIVSESRAAHEMLKTVKRLLGNVHNIQIIQMTPPYSLPSTKKKITQAFKKVDQHDGVLILNDFFGSTQCNICLPFLKKGKVEMITGYNLPLLLKILTLNKVLSFKALMKISEKYGKKHMTRIRGKTIT